MATSLQFWAPRKIGLDRVLATGQVLPHMVALVLAMIIARIIDRASKLATARQLDAATINSAITSKPTISPAGRHGLGMGCSRGAVARLHPVAESTPQFGGSDAMRRVIADNDRELAKVATRWTVSLS